MFDPALHTMVNITPPVFNYGLFSQQVGVGVYCDLLLISNGVASELAPSDLQTQL
jgi:hypothetical protein